MWGIMFTQGAALGYVIVGLSARLRPHYQFYRTAINKNKNGGDKASLNVVLGGFEPPQFFLYQDCSNKKETLKEPP